MNFRKKNQGNVAIFSVFTVRAKGIALHDLCKVLTHIKLHQRARSPWTQEER